ncbi:hypothetical protein MUN82_04665 [Hymenobacter aerilatus]|uniref:Outer membrane protein beta-barrel domain-containing protein n=1 Tax=Hymenobacter aerilatus TaxID=2932251 RepID=A0A8T9T1G0_9BACT|nr:hypothetical protein [Hymenobacter aerilatus]UOR06390.1 hypothetical protein MUN82_04665 [Hymenobacter aerilatus]
MLNYHKVAAIAAVLSFSSFTALAQRPASIQLGVGSALVGTGDYKALKAHVEYAPFFGRHLGTGTRLAFIGGSQESYQTVYNPDPRTGTTGVNVPFAMTYQAMNVEHEFYLYPFGNDQQVLFAVGGGGYAGYSQRYGAPQTTIDFSTGIKTNSLDQEKGLHAGYMLSLNLDVALGIDRQWLAGGKASFQNDTFGNTMATLQLKVGRRF